MGAGGEKDDNVMPMLRTGWPVLIIGLALARVAAADDRPPAPERWEPGGTPILSADSDIGVGLGAIGSLARFRRSCTWPYCWRLEAQVFFSVKDGTLPYHDHNLKLDLPGLLGGRLRLYLQAGFARYLNSTYYGMGNASPGPDCDALGWPRCRSRYYQYDRIYPQLQGTARFAITQRHSLIVGANVTYNWINLYGNALGNKLALDREQGDAATRDLLHGTNNHALAAFQAGWIYDSRDHELIPERGMHHEVSGRFSPELAGDNISYAGANVALRFYRGLWRNRLAIAVRVMADLLFGAPPFYELARCGGMTDTGAIGGGSAIRGVPMQRYYGKAKLLANLELRGRLIPFHIKSQRFNIGVVAFFDAGRTWADYGSNTLDGTGLGLKFGTGGGLRIQWGETFMLRGDVAYSPDASPIGFYIDVGHIF
jgi:hypothetical protein